MKAKSMLFKICREVKENRIEIKKGLLVKGPGTPVLIVREIKDRRLQSRLEKTFETFIVRCEALTEVSYSYSTNGSHTVRPLRETLEEFAPLDLEDYHNVEDDGTYHNFNAMLEFWLKWRTEV
ncbi:MAG: hypothetical protein CL489_06385 [Acidobacteria bacterium]|nr:hypothetical protein [Acidobacteriota bacterium]